MSRYYSQAEYADLYKYTVKNKRPPWHFKKIVKRKFVVQCLCGIFLHHNLVKTERHGAT